MFYNTQSKWVGWHLSQPIKSKPSYLLCTITVIVLVYGLWWSYYSSLILYSFCASDICKWVYYQQVALVPEHRSTPTSFGYYLLVKMAIHSGQTCSSGAVFMGTCSLFVINLLILLKHYLGRPGKIPRRCLILAGMESHTFQMWVSHGATPVLSMLTGLW
jgi:hypothetical protein